jgi:drug/metabolite transporter (DMT)-like permease
VIAVLGGLGAALAFAAATVCSARSSRLLAPAPVLGWVMAAGLLLVAPFVLTGGVPAGLGRSTVGWLVLAGAGNVAGLLCSYAGLRVGKISVVAPIVSTEGAVAAVTAALAGERIGGGPALALAGIVVGVVLAAVVRDPAGGGSGVGRGVPLAGAAAVLFGLSLYAAGRASAVLPVAWVLLPARLIGVLVLTIPLAVTGRLRLTRPAAPLMAAAGVGEVLGFAGFSLGARHGIAITAVLASQFAALAAVAAFLLFRERLSRVQLTGVAVIVVGVAALTALQA